tara:strand:- start:2313 stop:2741 length:429 start_codon:yes stop_codon:yes gene_type:complete
MFLKLNNFITLILFFSIFFSVAQRPLTGEKIFKNKYPNEQFNLLAEASLLVSNSLEDDIIVTLRDGGGHYITHLYLRAFEKYLIQNLPIGHFIYQYHNLKLFYESPERIPIVVGSKAYLDFYFSAGSKRVIGFEISRDDFFR